MAANSCFLSEVVFKGGLVLHGADHLVLTQFKSRDVNEEKCLSLIILFKNYIFYCFFSLFLLKLYILLSLDRRGS